MNFDIPTGAGNYPAGVSDNDFDLPSGGNFGRHKPTPPPPEFAMVYCPEGMHHYQAKATEDWWNARTETCPEHIEFARS